MTRKQRLEAVLRGEETDRPPVCFYELNGTDQNPEDTDEYNIYKDLSWKRLLDMARDESDRIILRPMRFKNSVKNIRSSAEHRTVIEKNGNRHDYYALDIKGRRYTWHNLRERDVDTVWNVEYPLKTPDDLAAWLDIDAAEEDKLIPDLSEVLKAENELGDAGIVAIDMDSPLCEAAQYFSMSDFLVVALQEEELFRRALENAARRKMNEVRAFAEAAPGRLWRVYGPEYACAPFLPPRLFDEYAAKYDAPIAGLIRQSGGYPRIHCHGNLKGVLPMIRKTGWKAIDPVEPPPQGDLTLGELRDALGDDIVIFGNIELNYIETLDREEFTSCVRAALREGPAKGRNFVLMPTAAPIGRVISSRVIDNYRIMIDECKG